MKAMILAAGFGTRMRPITYALPKPMIPLCNRPLISYTIESLLENGFGEIIVNLHHLPGVLEKYLTVEYSARCELRFSFEPEILGTGGGIRKVRDWLEGEDFAVVNADTIQFPPYEALWIARRERDALAALFLRRPPDGDRYTKVFFDGERITGFDEGTGEPLMFAGGHVLSQRVFNYLPDRPFSGIAEDVYIPIARSGQETITAVIDDGMWFDIGTPLRYALASDALRREMLAGLLPLSRSTIPIDGQTLSGVSSILKGEILDSVIGHDVEVDAEASISRTAIWDRSHIGRGATIVGSLIGADVEIMAGARVENVVICRALEGVLHEPDRSPDNRYYVTPLDPGQRAVFEFQ